MQPESGLDWNELWCARAKCGEGLENEGYWDKRPRRFSSTCVRSGYADEFLMRAGVRAGETVIGMGCGTGSLALPLAHEGVYVVACDLSGGMLSKLREQAQADGVADNLDIRKMSWLDSWDDLPIADAFFASRSLFSRDLRQTLLKMEAHTRRRICVTVDTSFSPGHDHEMLKASGRPEPAESEATYIVNLLLEMGRMPELSYILHNRLVFGESLEEVRANFEREDGPFTPQESALLDAHIAQHFTMGVDDAGAPAVLRDYRHRNEWAFISWDL